MHLCELQLESIKVAHFALYHWGFRAMAFTVWVLFSTRNYITSVHLLHDAQIYVQRFRMEYAGKTNYQPDFCFLPLCLRQNIAKN